MSMLALRLFSTPHAGKEFIRRERAAPLPQLRRKKSRTDNLAVYTFKGG